MSKFRLEDRLMALKTYVPGYDRDGTIHVSGEAFQAIQETAAEALEMLASMPAADVIENPIPVRCYGDCYWTRDDFGDVFTPPSSECGKDIKAFEKLRIDPCCSERDETDCQDCPFYINRDMIEQMESEYHEGEPTADMREIVTCKECTQWGAFEFCKFLKHETAAEFFCGLAERRKDSK